MLWKIVISFYIWPCKVVEWDEEKTRKRIYEELPKCNWLEEKIKNIELQKKEGERRYLYLDIYKYYLIFFFQKFFG